MGSEKTEEERKAGGSIWITPTPFSFFVIKLPLEHFCLIKIAFHICGII